MGLAMMTVLCLGILNLLAFAVIAIVGMAHGINYPFPVWFKNERDICFYLAIALTLVSFPFLASSQQRIRASLSIVIAFGTVMIIAFLTSRG
jgi:drug/metabolite transporter superfamily protein YnfA